MRPTSLHQAQLDADQVRVLEQFLRSPLRDDFYFTGGTALAGFYLRHRVSEGLDFFSPQKVALEAVQAFVTSLPDMTIEHFDRIHERRIFLLRTQQRTVKMEFSTFSMPRLFPLFHADDGLPIDSIEEIYVNKILAFADRREPKDETDLYFLLQQPGLFSFAEAIQKAEDKSSLRGLRYVIQRRLLAVSDDILTAHRECRAARSSSALPSSPKSW